MTTAEVSLAGGISEGIREALGEYDLGDRVYSSLGNILGVKTGAAVTKEELSAQLMNAVESLNEIAQGATDYATVEDIRRGLEQREAAAYKLQDVLNALAQRAAPPREVHIHVDPRVHKPLGGGFPGLPDN